MRDWRERNKEKQRAYQTAYMAQYMTEARREAARERARRYYEDHKAEILERLRAEYAAKPKKGRPSGERHVRWKGENVGYHALHVWVTRRKGRPCKCERCGTTTAKRFEWANIDHQYRRNLDDWLRLCTACHRKFDYENGLCEKGGPRSK